MRRAAVLPAIADTTGIAGLVDGSLTSATPLPDGMVSLRITTSVIEGRTRYIELVFAEEQVTELCLLLQRIKVPRGKGPQAGHCTVPCCVGIRF